MERSDPGALPSPGRVTLAAPARCRGMAIGAAVLAIALQASPANAQDPAPHTAPVAGGWTFKLTPHVWFAFMLLGEARRDRLGLILDIDYLDLSSTAQTPDNLFKSAKASAKALVGMFAAAYRGWEKPEAHVDVLGGGRLWSLEHKVKLNAGRLPARPGSEDKTWVDPIVGLPDMAA